MHIGVYNCVSVWVSCQVEHLAVSSQLDRVADGGHKQSQVTGLNTIKITLTVGVCVGVGAVIPVYVYCMSVCVGAMKNGEVEIDLFSREKERERAGEIYKDSERESKRRMGTKSKVTIKESK